VGYTNVGKSTLMNLLSKSTVLAENKLFATLDTTVRKIQIDNLPLLVSDTVGFIRKLPTQLVESFKSTLDEVREADVLLHIVDISHKNFAEHIESVNKIMTEIESIDKPTIMVFNKIDAYSPEPYDELDLINERTERNFTIEEWQKTWMSRMEGNCVFISAAEKENIPELRMKLYKLAAPIYAERFPFNQFLY
jgi:GTP-binding protein HflX